LKNVLETFGKLPEKIIKKYLKNIIEGNIYLIKKGIKLKNLKSSNILLEINGNLKLNDYIEYKSIIEFYEIYDKNNFNFTKKSQKISKYPIPWIIENPKNFYINEYDKENENKNNKEKDDIFIEKNINNNIEYLNLTYLSFLMLEMHTGRNMEFLQKTFPNFSEGNYFNIEINEKIFNFPEEISFEFKSIFYFFFEKKITNQDFEDILNHGFFY
jgi:serine/threonine protein kinase